jgi:glycosyltransferase involved in cell wall biosynthesis
MDRPEVSLIIPALNEAANLAASVMPIAKAFETAHVDYELIIVDNGSSDGTIDKALELSKQNPRVRALRLEQNQGKGGGILEGIKIAKASVLGWTDADGQVAPQDIPRVFAPMRAGAAMSKPLRISRKDTLWRKLQSTVYNNLFKLFFFVPYSDINGPPKFITRMAFEKIKPQQRDWFLDAECIINLSRLKMPIAEVTVEWNERSEGSSKIRLLTILEFLKNMVKFRLGLN